MADSISSSCEEPIGAVEDAVEDNNVLEGVVEDGVLWNDFETSAYSSNCSPVSMPLPLYQSTPQIESGCYCDEPPGNRRRLDFHSEEGSLSS